MTQCNTNLKISVFDSGDAVAESIAQQWLDLSKRATIVNISLSGGSTPKHVFGFIARSDFARQILWQHLHFWWGDERCIPANDAQSNYGEAMRLLFSQVEIPAENLHPINGELSPEKACIAFKNDMAACLPMKVVNGRMRPIYDWVILGVGEDGHTASLFPGKTDYQALQNAVLAYHPDTKQARVSLSTAAVCSAKRVTYLALGEGKKSIVATILNNAPSAEGLPAAKIKSTQGLTEWYLDEQSASDVSTYR
ncbi:MAG: 6-phosphogluconolactonase [Pseudohongiellaceae bacterium]|jgi:6-phosphogluconolactonase